MDKQGDDNWLPLQSNPKLMTEFLSTLGLNTERYIVEDILSTQSWALQMIGRPVLGIIFLYKLSQPQRQYDKQQQQLIQNGQKHNQVSQNVFFMKQYAKNACGTIALFHIVLNNMFECEDLVREGSDFTKFCEQNFGKTPQEIGQGFKGNANLCTKHKQSVKKGQTKIKNRVDTHFIAFVSKDNNLYSLDGRKPYPINHGECLPDELPEKACAVIKQIMKRDQGSQLFTLLSLGRRMQF